MLNHVQVAGMPLIIDNLADNSLDQYGLSIQSDWAVLDSTFIVAGYEFNYDDLDAKVSLIA